MPPRFPLLLASILLGSSCSPPVSEVERDSSPRIATPPAGARKASPASVEAPAPEQARPADPRSSEEPETNKEPAPTPEAEKATRKAEEAAEKAAEAKEAARQARYKAEEAAEKAREKARRRGKKTGLGAPDEKPEVVVEELLRAIAAGKVDVRRFLDPDRVVLDMTSMPGASEDGGTEEKHLLCDGARRMVLEQIKHMVKKEKEISKWEPTGKITCGHEFAHHPDPSFTAVRGWRARSPWHGTNHSDEELQNLKARDLTPLIHVRCSLKTGGEWAEDLHLDWVPDPRLGWRIAALITNEVGALDGDLWFQAATVVAGDLRCPLFE